MDSLDREVLLALQADGSQSSRALARSLHQSPVVIAARVRHLERSGAILGYRAVVDPAAFGIAVRAFALARLEEHSERSIREFEKDIQTVHGVRACYQVAGQVGMMIELALHDLNQLSRLVRVDIAGIPGVMTLEILLILAELVADQGWPDLTEPVSDFQAGVVATSRDSIRGA